MFCIWGISSSCALSLCRGFGLLHFILVSLQSCSTLVTLDVFFILILLPATTKQPFEAKAKEQKEAYEKFKNTAEGQKALEEKKAERKDAKESKAKRDAKKAAKAVEKDDKLKKPPSAYFLFANAKREEVQKLLGTKDFGPVTKKIGEMWKDLSDAARKPWDAEAQKQKDEYDAYVKSAEGAAALQAYKDEVKEAKASAKGKRAGGSDAPAAKAVKTAGA